MLLDPSVREPLLAAIPKLRGTPTAFRDTGPTCARTLLSKNGLSAASYDKRPRT